MRLFLVLRIGSDCHSLRQGANSKWRAPKDSRWVPIRIKGLPPRSVNHLENVPIHLSQLKLCYYFKNTHVFRKNGAHDLKNSQKVVQHPLPKKSVVDHLKSKIQGTHSVINPWILEICNLSLQRCKTRAHGFGKHVVRWWCCMAVPKFHLGEWENPSEKNVKWPGLQCFFLDFCWFKCVLFPFKNYMDTSK